MGQFPIDLRVVVVDDEARICNGVARFLLKRWPELEIQKFDNGIDALAAIKQNVPDLLITDLRMPEMDGLELIEEGMVNGLAHAIVLTAYDEFELMQRAIRLHAHDYLLKPVDRDQLYHAVENVALSIEKQWELDVFMVIQYGVVEALPGASRLMKTLNRPDDVCLLAMTPDNEQAVTLMQFTRATEYTAFLQVTPVMNLIVAPKSTAEALLATWHEKAPEVCLGAVCPIDLETLHRAWQQLNHQAQRTKPQLVNAFSVQKAPAALANALQTSFADCTSSESCWHKLVEIQHILNLRCEQWRLLLLLNDIQAGHFDSLADLFLHHAIPCQKLSPIVLRVCEYVDQYYMQEIKLSQIAAQVFVTPNYLSTIFHQEMGMTLINYINQVRIDHACIQMLEQEQSLEQLAACSGFFNTNYFFKVFRQITDMTPGNFRKLIS